MKILGLNIKEVMITGLIVLVTLIVISQLKQRVAPVNELLSKVGV